MNESQWELEAKLLYAVVVAGKNAKFADEKIRLLLDMAGPGETPFELVRLLVKTTQLMETLRAIKTGNYNKICKAFEQIVAANLDLTACTPADLEKIHGIGPKTSRFFILWTRPDANYAALDVHVLRWLRSLGYPAPQATPGDKKKYAELESIFLKEAVSRRKTARQLDLEIWEAGSRKNNIPDRKD
jgi:thermostable 8-oxoguanine DNA glycosylase